MTFWQQTYIWESLLITVLPLELIYEEAVLLLHYLGYSHVCYPFFAYLFFWKMSCLHKCFIYSKRRTAAIMWQRFTNRASLWLHSHITGPRASSQTDLLTLKKKEKRKSVVYIFVTLIADTVSYLSPPNCPWEINKVRFYYYLNPTD